MKTKTPYWLCIVFLGAFLAGCGDTPDESADSGEGGAAAAQRDGERDRQAVTDALQSGKTDNLVSLADGGNIMAMNTVLHLASAKDTNLDGRSLAGRWVELSDRLGSVDHRLFAARHRLTGRWIHRDIERAESALMALSQEGALDADVILGIHYAYNPTNANTKTANQYLASAAEAGSAIAQFYYAANLESGHGVVKNLPAAASWYRKAAEQRNPSAQHNLAMMYLEGRGVDASPFRAQRYLKQAVEQNYLLSQYHLGRMMVIGNGVRLDFEGGRELLRTALDREFSPAGLSLGDTLIEHSHRQFNGQLYVDGVNAYLEAYELGHPLAGIKAADSMLDGNLVGLKSRKLDSRRDILLYARKILEPLIEDSDPGIRHLAQEVDRGAQNLLVHDRRERQQKRRQEWKEMDGFEQKLYGFTAAFVTLYAIGHATREATPDSVIDHLATSGRQMSAKEIYDENMRRLKESSDRSSRLSFDLANDLLSDY